MEVDMAAWLLGFIPRFARCQSLTWGFNLYRSFGLCLGFIANWASFKIRYPPPPAHGPYYSGLYYPGVIATLIAIGPVAVFNRTEVKWEVLRTISYLVGIVVIGQILNFWFQREITLHLVFMLGPLLLLGFFCIVFSDFLWKRLLTRTC